MKSVVGPASIISLLLLISTCSRAPEPEETTAPELEKPMVAAVAGAQDLWPFTFGLDADRDAVQQILGPPERTEERDIDRSDITVVTWFYAGLEISFFRQLTQDGEYVLSARFTDPEQQLGMGMHVGMSEQDAVAVLGEPGYRAGDTIVYFYYTTTIELVLDDERVSTIVLARALP